MNLCFVIIIQIILNTIISWISFKHLIRFILPIISKAFVTTTTVITIMGFLSSQVGTVDNFTTPLVDVVDTFTIVWCVWL